MRGQNAAEGILEHMESVEEQRVQEKKIEVYWPVEEQANGVELNQQVIYDSVR